MRAIGFLISCEHASAALPGRYRRLGLPAPVLRSHVAWDPGAREVARRLARALNCVYHEGRYSRLLIDLNRSLDHRQLIPARSAGVTVPGNFAVSGDERERRLRRYYTPYRAAVTGDIGDLIARFGACTHLSIHSFVPALRGIERRADIGLLYDPARAEERSSASRLAGALRAQDLHVRLNFPYRGVNDGLTTHYRRLFSPQHYVGLEIEVNQRLLRRRADLLRVAQALQTSLRAFARR